MRQHSRFFCGVGLLCVVAVLWFWLRVRDDAAKGNPKGPAGNASRTASGSASSASLSKRGVVAQAAPGQPAAAALTTGGNARRGAPAPNAGPAAGGPPK